MSSSQLRLCAAARCLVTSVAASISAWGEREREREEKREIQERRVGEKRYERREHRSETLRQSRSRQEYDNMQNSTQRIK